MCIPDFSVICGITEDTTNVAIIRAALEAVCFQTRDILDAMNKDCGIPLTKLLVDGGMTVNSYVMQLQADLCGIPVGLYLHVLQHMLVTIISKTWKLHHVCSFFCLSAWNNSAPSEFIFMKFDI